MPCIDLHTHTNCSDGLLSPEELLLAAREKGIELLSITDHDTLAAYRSLPRAIPEDINLLVGIELSSVWRRMNIHVVGLDVDPESEAMLMAEQLQRTARLERFDTIIQRLQKRGLEIDRDALIETSGQCPGRPHIARYLKETGQLKSESQAFERYLGQGKIGDVKEGWPELEKIVGWIKDSGGVAVLAHPLKYGLTRTKLLELVSTFKEAGGQAIEVVSGQQTAQQINSLAGIARRFELLASQGSDFHRPNQPWASLGKVASLPADLKPVWQLFI